MELLLRFHHNFLPANPIQSDYLLMAEIVSWLYFSYSSTVFRCLVYSYYSESKTKRPVSRIVIINITNIYIHNSIFSSVGLQNLRLSDFLAGTLMVQSRKGDMDEQEKIRYTGSNKRDAL